MVRTENSTKPWVQIVYYLKIVEGRVERVEPFHLGIVLPLLQASVSELLIKSNVQMCSFQLVAGRLVIVKT